MNIKVIKEYYKQAKFLYHSIDDLFNKFESGSIEEENVDTYANRALDDVNVLFNKLNKIDISDLTQTYSQEDIEKIQRNLDFMYEAADYFEKYFLGKKYFRSVVHSVKKYFESMKIDEYDYNRYANDLDEYCTKFASVLLHPDNIKQYINQIKRISTGTMSLNEFKKIYEALRGKVIKLPKYTFESFKNYIQNNETQN